MVEYNKYNITLTNGFRGAKKRLTEKINVSDDAWYYLGLVGQIGYAIALPIAGGAILGSLIDHRFGLSRTGASIGIVTGIVVSAVGFVQVIRKILQKQK
jgi:hypothetical protein